MLLDDAPDALGVAHRAGLRGVREDRGEVVVLPARHDREAARVLHEEPRDLLEHLIARGPPLALVELLEVVEVDVDEREGMAESRPTLGFLVESKREITPVEEVGQRVLDR